MKVRLLLAFFVLANNVFGQTENHKIIPGTKCSIIPPKGFVLSSDFNGFENTELGASIMVIELPGPYNSIIASFTKEDLKLQGMLLLGMETVDFNSSKATLIKASQEASGSTYLKQILIFGDSSKTVLVNGIYPEESKNIENDIKTSILSISYNEDQNDDPLKAAQFEIDVTGSDFKIAKNIAGALAYTTDGQIPTRSADKAVIIISGSLGRVATTDKRQFSIAVLKQMIRGESNIPKEINPITINKLKGFEIVADGKDANNNKELIYVVTLFKENGEYYIVRGSTTSRFDHYLPVFKKIAKTFKLK